MEFVGHGVRTYHIFINISKVAFQKGFCSPTVCESASFLTLDFFFLSLPIGWRNIFLPQIVFLWFLVELSYFVTFGSIYISSRNCILPICCSFFIKDVPHIFRMIIFCLKHVACLFFLSRYFSKWRTHCSHLSSHLCFQLIRNAASITVLCVASHLSPLLFHWLIFCSCTRIKVL